ncbi:iron-sulfur cluster biosynthesis transcriptional regulator SufR [Microcystis aeruginosa]|jgi:DeoR family suf operon transcriptional repressor|uniref:iron-sulfur cluster biosynthesis transcriptional regulator SufR n=1 Tax=Microcystis aeruginosa TaxID=1126 RepID=UPI00232BD281|nr:iron-sulfur cluster biosynthesis transcriptional regulator SufR [Microcystis aeruginosa]MDB9432282.1 iron-sulfur cluster biosynthesis transcriptional regulator SufR [Microcystis aeruginosa CS-552/01]
MTTTQPASTKDDILQYLLKNGQSTAQDLAEELSISPQATRRHLKDLEGEGLIEYFAVQNKIGRPQHIYRLSRQGRGRFPHNYDNFAVSFLNTLVETVGEQQVGEILKKQWQRKAAEYQLRLGKGALGERMRKLLEIRQEEGYMAELVALEAENSYILAEHHCAIAEVAGSYPSICGHELEMFAMLLPDCTIERTHWINQGEQRCGYLIKCKG